MTDREDARRRKGLVLLGFGYLVLLAAAYATGARPALLIAMVLAGEGGATGLLAFWLTPPLVGFALYQKRNLNRPMFWWGLYTAAWIGVAVLLLITGLGWMLRDIDFGPA